MNKFISAVTFITISSLPLLMQYFLIRKHKKSVENIKEDEDFYHHTIFINMNNFNCKQHLINRKECSEYCSYIRQKTLLNFISSAKLSICVCMYMLTLKQVVNELIKAHLRGVSVRIITDKVMVQADPSRCNFDDIEKNGIPYKVQPSVHCMMHHKFCLIDKEDRDCAKMFFGSLNLTIQGLVSNFDAVVLTNNSTIIEKYSEEFDELWNSF